MMTHLVLSSPSFRRRPACMDAGGRAASGTKAEESRKFVPGWLHAPRLFPVGPAQHFPPVLFQDRRYFCPVLSFRARRRFSSFRAQALDSFMSCFSDSSSDLVNRRGPSEMSGFCVCEFVDAIVKSLLPKLIH